jgi:2-polyprenyl-3-methyl-5-hydroxy-6-metoxy-1,4-benzoquinol methylase
MIDYRTRIYERYASSFRNTKLDFDERAKICWGKAFDYYFRGWLPKQNDAMIADLACGDGNLLYFFKRRGYTHTSGVDISPEQVQIAKQVNPGVVEADVIDFLETRPETFDLITGLDIIEHLQKDEILRFLDGCLTALKPGGRLILQTPNAESPWGNSIRYGDFTHEVCFSPDSLKSLMRLCGFHSIETREQGAIAWGYSFACSIRYLIWQVIRLGLKVYNLAETGHSGSGVFTRVFVISGRKNES